MNGGSVVTMQPSNSVTATPISRLAGRPQNGEPVLYKEIRP